jgi:hypothetical protein
LHETSFAAQGFDSAILCLLLIGIKMRLGKCASSTFAQDKAYACLKTLGLEPGASYEEYIDDPVGEDMKDVRTDIVIAVTY